MRGEEKGNDKLTNKEVNAILSAIDFILNGIHDDEDLRSAKKKLASDSIKVKEV